MKKSLELRQQRKELFDKAGAITDLIALEKREMTGDEKTKFDSYCVQVESLHPDIEREERAERLEKARFDADLQVQPQVARDSQVEVLDRAAPGLRGSNEYRSAFINYIRGGKENLRPEEMVLLQKEVRSALGTGSGAAGGFLVPETFQTEIERAVKAFGGMREVSRGLATDGGNDLPWPTTNDTSNEGEILAENPAAATTELAVTFGQVVFKAYEYSSKSVPVSVQLLQDSAVNLEQLLASLLGERIARIQNKHFTSGDDANKPQGVINGASVGKTATGGQTTSIIYTDLTAVAAAMDPAYDRNARWMWNKKSFYSILDLTDANGFYYFKRGDNGAPPNNILGYPYTINQHLADFAASARPILLGDFSKYVIRDVRGISVFRDDITKGLYRQVVFCAFARADGRVIDAGTKPILYFANPAA